jgi:hypothetical protein
MAGLVAERVASGALLAIRPLPHDGPRAEQRNVLAITPGKATVRAGSLADMKLERARTAAWR